MGARAADARRAARVSPGGAVSLSSEVLPEYREYERAMTTLVDAFIKAACARYVGPIGARIAAGSVRLCRSR